MTLPVTFILPFFVIFIIFWLLGRVSILQHVFFIWCRINILECLHQLSYELFFEVFSFE